MDASVLLLALHARLSIISYSKERLMFMSVTLGHFHRGAPPRYCGGHQHLPRQQPAPGAAGNNRSAPTSRRLQLFSLLIFLRENMRLSRCFFVRGGVVHSDGELSCTLSFWS